MIDHIAITIESHMISKDQEHSIPAATKLVMTTVRIMTWIRREGWLMSDLAVSFSGSVLSLSWIQVFFIWLKVFWVRVWFKFPLFWLKEFV